MCSYNLSAGKGTAFFLIYAKKNAVARTFLEHRAQNTEHRLLSYRAQSVTET